MNPLVPLLESFYARETPLGVAFVGSARFGASLGRPADSVLPFLSSTSGFTQLHLENQGLSVYASYFGWGKLLVAQFGFQEALPPPMRPWLAFVRLAAAAQRVLENPDDLPEPPVAGVPVLKPNLSGPHSRQSSAEVRWRIAND